MYNTQCAEKIRRVFKEVCKQTLITGDSSLELFCKDMIRTLSLNLVFKADERETAEHLSQVASGIFHTACSRLNNEINEKPIATSIFRNKQGAVEVVFFCEMFDGICKISLIAPELSNKFMSLVTVVYNDGKADNGISKEDAVKIILCFSDNITNISFNKNTAKVYETTSLVARYKDRTQLFKTNFGNDFSIKRSDNCYKITRLSSYGESSEIYLEGFIDIYFIQED